MTDSRHDGRTDIVDDAVRDLRDRPIPAGPDERALARALTAVRAAADADRRPSLKERIITMKRWIRYAAAAVIVIGVGCAIGVLLFGSDGTNVAFGDVRDRILKVQTIRFKMHMTMTVNGKQQTMTSTMQAMEPGLMRVEMPGGAINIVNMERGESLTLIPQRKMAVRTKMLNVPEDIRKQNDQLGKLKEFIQGADEELGEKQIDGKRAVGYRVSKGGQAMEVWVDPDTMNPVRIEMAVSGGEATVTLTDFVMNPELDESLFSLEAPEGYTVEEKTMDFDVKEADLTDGLKLLAKYNDGKFPPGAMPMLSKEIIQNVMKSIEDAGEPKEVGEKQAKDLADAYQRLILFQAMRMGDAEDWKYFGGGVKLGDGDSAIMWWRPKDAQTYRVLFGDLTFKDVAPEDLPSTQPADGGP